MTTSVEANPNPQANQSQRTAVLNRLASLYPALFGAEFLPMKRGIYQDLLAAHPDEFEADALKQALAFHARSTRYLSAVASGLARHDLQAQPVEAMAPEHVHHALLEVFKRRKQRSREDLRPKLLRRLIQALLASGLSAQAYADLVRSPRDEAANTLLDEALALWRSEQARDQALAQAFKNSGLELAEFADAYGLKLAEVKQRLARLDLLNRADKLDTVDRVEPLAAASA
jgi:hypothetical protein